MKVKSQLEQAQLENVTSNPTPGKKGLIQHNTVSGLNVVDDGSAIRTLVTTDNTQTLTNKSLSDSTTTIVDESDNTKKIKFQVSGVSTGTTREITAIDADMTLVGLSNTQTLSNKTFSDAITQSEISTPSTPASNLWKIYPKSDGYYQLDDAGTETKFANSLTAYVSKTHADTGATLAEGFTLWTLTNTNNDTATIPAAASNAGKIFTIKLAATTAAFNTLTLNRSGSDTFTLADGTTGETSLVLQTAGETYELLSDGTSVWQVLQHKTKTAATSFTPTGTWSTNTTYTGRWHREGQYFVSTVKLALAGAPTSANLEIDIPFSLIISLADLPGAADANGFLSVGSCSSAGLIYPVFVVYSTTTKVLLRAAADSTRKLSPVTQAVPDTFGSGDFIVFNLTVPITGWKA